MNKKTIRDIDVADKKALVRVDLNVPQSSDTGAISADTKIKAIIPTLQFLIDGRARVILCSHLGRPKGKVIESMRLAPVAQRLSEIIGRPVATTGDCIGEEVERAASVLGDGDILLLENLRFHAEEESNDLDFARALANLAEIYINDAFGTAHRTHASTVGVATFLPAIAGFLMEKEIESMDNALNDPARPFATIVGGAKI
ncbi:MAG: phosphoglycerate kinase, partial [Chloroflexota bacterium]|nr:phosphoglycerate kinase [Chloroflexota bacterium]